tara:strand:+ start:95 stop:1078 length:984 start_codon:yes stop_codon:yes gene_type:complete
VIYFITPDLNSISGGNKYDINVLNYLNKNYCKVINISLTKHTSNRLLLYLRINRIPLHSTLIIDGLLAFNLSTIVDRLSIKYKVILLIHHPVSYEFQKNGKIEHKLRERKIFSKADKIISVSNSMKKVINKMLNSKKNINVIKPAVDDIYRKQLLNNTNSKNIVTTGSVIPRKNIDKCIEVLSKLEEEWSLSIIGKYDVNDTYYKKLISYINSNKLNKRITFHNVIENQDDLINILRNSSVYICLSNYEGYGMANVESASLGLPLIVSDLPVFRENLIGYNRKYVDVNNPSLIAKAVKDISRVNDYKTVPVYNWKDVGLKFKKVLYG